MKRILLLTATITPRSGEPLLQLTDPTNRMQDYKKAFLFYLDFLGAGIDNILFVENSEADLNFLQETIPDHLHAKTELISFYGLDYPVEHGRGYGEFRLIDYAMKNANIFKNCSESDTIIKITGRYRLLNFDKILRKLPSGYDLYCNHRNYPIRWADMFLISWSKSFYFSYFDTIYTNFKMDETGEAPEVSLRKYLSGIQQEIKLVPRYVSIPKVEAAKAMNNQSYQGFTNKVKYYLRSFINKAFPWLWI